MQLFHKLWRPLDIHLPSNDFHLPLFCSQDVQKARLEPGREADQDAGDLLREEGLLPAQGVGKNRPKGKR